jgi:hypothetical protein
MDADRFEDLLHFRGLDASDFAYPLTEEAD